MKVLIKTLKQQSNTVEIEPEDKVSVLKDRINAAFSVPPEAQKLIVAGKIITDDDATIASYGINESSFIILMEKKVTQPTPVKPDPITHEKPAETKPTVSQPQVNDSASASASASASVTAEPKDANSAVFAESITQLMGMGFPRSECETALRAAFGNPDRAVEYLLNGIPENLSREQPANRDQGQSPQAPAQTRPEVESQSEDLFGGTGADSTEGTLPPAGIEEEAALSQIVEGLANDTNFQTIALSINANPSMLSVILPAFARANPRLGQLFTARPELMSRIVARVVELVGPDGVAAFNAVQANEAMEEGEGARPQQGQGGQQAIRSIFGQELSPDDQAAITRLCDLGFDRSMVIQAYVACGKNETAAANFLIENSAF